MTSPGAADTPMNRTAVTRTQPILAAALAALLASAWPGPQAAAQPAGGPARTDTPDSPHAAFAAQTWRIPAAALDTVLSSVARQAGVLLSYEPGLARGKTSGGVQGQLTLGQAFSQALAGSGLEAVLVAEGRYTLRPAPDNASDNVTALAPLRVTGTHDTDMPGAVSTEHIGREQLDRFSPTNAGDLFNGVPGVMAANNRSGASLDLNIRGLQGMGRVKILVDGTQSASSDYRGYAGHQSHTYVDPELLSDVTIEKGPNSGPYGAGASGGVVNLRTLDADDLIKDGEQYGARLRGTWGNNAGHSGSAPDGKAIPGHNYVLSAAGAWRANDNVDLVLGVSQRKSANYRAGSRGDASYSFNGHDIPISPYAVGAEVNNTSQDTRSVLFKTGLRLSSEQRLDLGFTYYDSMFGSPRTTVGDFYAQQLHLSRTKKKTYSARYAWTPLHVPWLDLRINVWRSEADEFRANDYVSFGQTAAQSSDNRSHGMEAWNTSQFGWSWMPELSLQYGFSYSKERINVSEQAVEGEDASYMTGMDPSGERQMAAAFMQFQARFSPWLAMHGGLRYDRYDLKGRGSYPSPYLGQQDIPVNLRDHDSRLNPSIGLTFTPWTSTSFFARYSEGWRPAMIKEAVTAYTSGKRPDTPALFAHDGLLRPEISKSLEIGMQLQADDLLRARDRGSLNLTWFDTRNENYITGGLGVFRNTPEVRYRGLELALDYDAGLVFVRYGLTRYFSAKVCGQLGGSDCLPYEYSERGLELAGINPPPRFLQSLTIGTRLLERKLTLGLRITDAGRRSLEKRVAGSGATDEAAGWVPYTIYDLFGSYQVSPNLAIHASVENLRDQFYMDAGTNLNSAIPAPGRTARLSLTYKF